MSEFTGKLEVKDLMGQVVSEGDRIAGGFRVGNTAQLRVGTVLGFFERGNKLVVKAHWTNSSGYLPPNGITGDFDPDLSRFILLEADNG